MVLEWISRYKPQQAVTVEHLKFIEFQDPLWCVGFEHNSNLYYINGYLVKDIAAAAGAIATLDPDVTPVGVTSAFVWQKSSDIIKQFPSCLFTFFPYWCQLFTP